MRHFLEIVRGVVPRGDGVLDLWRHFAVLAVMAAAVLLAAIMRFSQSMRRA